MPSVESLQFDGALTNVAVQFQNEALIADEIFPRLVVPNKEGTYKVYGKDEWFTVPNDLTGPDAAVNEVDWSASDATFACLDRGLEKFLSQEAIDNAVAPFTPQATTTKLVANLIGLGRENRVVAIVLAEANYDAGRQLDVAHAWDTLTTDVVAQINTAIDACFMAPNIMVMGPAVWNELQRNETLIAAIKGALQTQRVTPEDVASYFGLDKVFVGRAQYNSAVEGQTATYARAWDVNEACALLRVSPSPGTEDAMFGQTFQWGTKTTFNTPTTRGARGGQMIRVVESVVESIVTNDVGYLFFNTIA